MMKRLSLLLFVCFCFGKINAQAFMLGTDVGGTAGTLTYYPMSNASNKIFYEKMITENVSSSTGIKKWEFTDGGNNTWRAASSGQTLSLYNSVIAPASNNASAFFRASSGGATAQMPPTVSGTNYYFRIAGIAGQNNYASQNMVILAATYTPNTLVGASHTAGTNIVTLSTALSPGEYMYVRSSLNSFSSSNISQVNFTGTSGTFSLGNCSSSVSYYFYTSSAPLANITASVTSVGQNAHYLLAFYSLNNGGSNYTTTPPAVSISGTSPICAGSTTTLTATGSSGVPPYSYTWSSGSTSIATLSASSGATTILTGVAVGSSIITVTVTDVIGCTNTNTKTEVLGSLPSVVISGSANICTGTATTILTALSSNGTSPYTYSWSSATPSAAALSSSTGTNVTVTVGASGSSIISVTVTDAGGCTNTSTQTETVRAVPTPTISGSNTVCATPNTILIGTPTVASGSTFDGTKTANFTWSSSNTSAATVSGLASTAVTVTGTTAGGATTITYTIKDNFGCSGSGTYAITANPTPSYTSAVAAASICSQYPATINLTGLTPNSTFNISYNISHGTEKFVNGITSNASGAGSFMTTNVPSNGTNGLSAYSINYDTIKNSITTCSNIALGGISTTLSVNRGPLPTIIGSSNVCAGGSISLTGTPNIQTGSTSSPTITWSSSNTSVATVNSSGTVTSGVAGTTIISYYVKGANGCDSTTTKTITVNPLPTPVVAGSSSVCVGSTTALSASSSTGTSPFTYAWSSATPSKATLSPSNISATTVTGVAAGSSIISVTITDNNSCVASIPQTETVNALPTVSIAAIESSCTSNDNKVLNGATVSLTASGSGGSGSYTTYTWDNSLGTGATKTPTVTATTTYNVTVTDSNGCMGTNAQTETLITAPTFSNTKIDDPCQVGVGSITVTLTGGTPTYTIAACGTTISPTPSAGTYVTVSGSPTTISSSGGSKIFSNLPGNATYKFTITDTNGCPAQ